MAGPLLRLEKLFASSRNIESFPAGATVFQQGEAGDSMYVVLEGTVDIMLGDKLLDLSGPGDLLGEMSLIDNKARSATAVARTDVKLARVDESAFLTMVQETPFFALHVMRVLVERMRRSRARL
ncbi:MAG TPA: cyclic nucleotide-binding domain-containing protein [Candidatus Limnocylindrales bacterium]|nr:cyclic nucleotide-binding domain-containing protein [Candidatus Limnocylindrales bacterium]